jgi:cellulose synthase/poly-beta-1,6-N-acetylglucosamine synthase-like glycosyltransferase
VKANMVYWFFVGLALAVVYREERAAKITSAFQKHSSLGDKPFISVIIPCRNERNFIAQCLNSWNLQNYPSSRMEILVVDGMSEDGTKEIVQEYAKKFSCIKLLENEKKVTPFALNIGITSSQGDVIIRSDAHATYNKDYISKCVACLQEFDADAVGGVIQTTSSEDSFVAQAITLSLKHPFGVGDASFRSGSKKSVWVDTVFGGCYRKEVFEKIGLFNENLIRSQDMEFNLRLKRAGGKILLAPDITSVYYPKSTLREFFVHNFKDGIWAVYPLRFTRVPFRFRHYIPLIFLATLPVSIWVYIPLTLLFSARIAWQQKQGMLFVYMPIAFAVRHFAYGVGSFVGMIKLLPRVGYILRK